ncbi:MAG: InaA protein, partial [Pseudomonas sp.]|nr:InaA protein [Pseudomonas sp.]
EPRAPLLNQVMLQRLAVTLARLHLGGWQHGCCYAKHLFVKVRGDGDVDIALLDLEKSRRRWRASSAARRDLGQLDRHRGAMPEADMRYLRQAYQHALSTPWGGLQP